MIADTLAVAADSLRWEPLSWPWAIVVCALWAVFFAWILGRALAEADATDGPRARVDDELTL